MIKPTPAKGNNDLPRGWRWAALGDVADYINGKAFKPEEWESSGLPIVRIQNLNKGSAPYNYYSGNVQDQHLIKDGDLLVSWSASLDAFIWNRGDAILNQHIFKVVENSSLVERKFLYFSIKNAMDAIKEKIHGATMQHITKPVFESVKIPLPPLAEQKRIVAVLNKQMAAVERARGAALERVGAVRALPSAWLREVFSFDNGLPRGWRWATLGEIATSFRGVNFSSGEARPTPKDGYTACLTTSGVQAIPNWNSRRFIPNHRIKDNSQLLSVGDIMISTANSKALVGKSCLVSDIPYECAFGAFVTVIRPSAQITSEWLSCAINTNQAKRFFYEKSSHTTNISNLKVSTLLDMRIPLPPLTKQKRLVASLNAKMAATEKARAAAAAELEAIAALPAALLRQAFSGAL